MVKHIELSTKTKGALSQDYFKFVNVPEEKGKRDRTDIWSNPAKLLKIVGFGENFVEKRPFRYLKTYAYIWEYSLLHLCMQLHPNEVKVRKTEYLKLRKKSKNIVKPERYIPHGPGKLERWENYYQWDVLDEDAEAIGKLAEDSLEFCELLLNRNVGIRDYGESKKDCSEYLKLRRQAATAFFKFLIEGKGNFSFEGEDFDSTLLALLKQEDELSEHVIAVSMLYCLYGRLSDKKNGKKLNSKLVKQLVIRLNKRWSQKTETQHKIINYLKQSERTGLPCLSSYYDFKLHKNDAIQRINIFKRINIWIDFLKQTNKIRIEKISNVKSKIVHSDV